FLLMSPQAILGPDPVTIKTDDFRLEIQGGTKATFPNNKTQDEVFLTPLKDARTPVELPFGYFSSSTAQITPFNVKLEPGARLIFPNNDGIGVGDPVILFRYDQEEGKFVKDDAKAIVSSDGKSIETEKDAIKITSYFFAARARDLTTIIGKVFEKDGKTPIVHAQASFRGQESFTDGAGGYVLRYVPVMDGEEISVDVRVVRPNGRVDRTGSAEVLVRPGETTKAPNVSMPGVKDKRPPTLIAPSKI